MAPHLYGSTGIARLIAASLAYNTLALGKAAPSSFDDRTCAWPPPASLASPAVPPQCPWPMDDHVGDARPDWAPWSHRPYCVYPDKKRAKYCLYSQDSFRNGHGLSVIATPPMAASLATALDDSVVRSDVRAHPSARIYDVNGTELSYEVRQLPGRGLGVVARRPIKKWEVIMVDFPVLIAEMDLLEVMSEEQRRRILRRALLHVDPRERSAVMGLARAFGGDATEDILRTNILAVEVGGQMHMALFTQASVSGFYGRPDGMRC